MIAPFRQDPNLSNGLENEVGDLDTNLINRCQSLPMKKASLSRRSFLTHSALTANATNFPFISVRNVLEANERLNIAGICARATREVQSSEQTASRIASKRVLSV